MKSCLLILFCLPLVLTAQPGTDSTTFANAQWKQEKIAPGIYLRTCWFDHSLFGASQNISILEIKATRKNRLDVEADPVQLKPTSTFGKEYDALAAINGTFFDMKNGGSVDYVRLDGKALNATRLRQDSSRIFHQKAAIVFNGKKTDIISWNGNANWEPGLAGEDIMVTGPLLVNDHTIVPMDTISFYTARHPRSAVAIKGNKILLVTVDGRNLRAAGMSLPELARVLRWLKADKAINLDGGGSTTLWVKGFPEGGVINYPSDNKKMEKSPAYKPGVDLDNLAADVQKWDHTGERPVANVILVNRRK